MITVFYDDRCGVCAKEIAYYQKISPKGVFFWEGISKNQSTLQRLNISLYKGVDAFIKIWQYLPYFKWLSILVSLPIVYHSACWLYSFFAKYRFARLPHCQAVLKKTKKDEGLNK